MSRIVSIVMAAGHGTRMKSALPKVLHKAAGRPLVHYPVATALELGAAEVIVVGNAETAPKIEASLSAEDFFSRLAFAIQEVPRGTGDAVKSGIAGRTFEADDIVVILSGDTPLLAASDVLPIVERVRSGDVLSLLSFEPCDPTGYGRVLRDKKGNVVEIREHRDLRTEEEKRTTEVNAGVYAVRFAALAQALSRLSPNNAQGEYYLTDIVSALAETGSVSAALASEASLLGVNHRGELAAAETFLFARIAAKWAKEGITIVGKPLIDDTVTLSEDVTLEDGVRVRGRTRIERGAFIDVGSVIVDSTIGERVTVKPYSVVTESIVEAGAKIGPFSHLRPKSHIGLEAHIGNFVETKNTRVRAMAKANHLAYLGDGDIGEKANIGAGTIFCNYDGFSKARTTIGKEAFIGSDSQLVAPVTIGDGAYVATGTTVTNDVPAGALAVGRARQTNKEGYAELLRERLRERAAEKKRNG